MSEPSMSDSVRFYRPRLMPGVELVSVCYRERSFPEHSHSEYVVGAVVAGAETLTVAGPSNRVDTGNVLRLHPDEAHANATIGPDILRYDVLYLREDTIRPYLDRGRHGGALRFQMPVSDDPALLAAVSAAHAALGCDLSGRMEQESALAVLVQALAVESCGVPDTNESQPVHAARIIDAKAYIDANYADGFGLHDLARLSGLSVFHFTRSFKKAVGLSPLAYRNQRRVTEARMRLLDGQPIAQVALDMGYADQSHLTRQFQRIVGASPRRYAQQ
ncbi:AraC family transcriptional regulator [Sphingomonas sp. CFBP 13733]|uniref:AraC family transcriptional regulator n=1 Tax=Sphingomonas sp. CFBP 13733 TaxID=2775291 RepID=UPI00177F06CF|nr:AraC family transcriptional regulator [Sphingomonas sp. CFBP 13733]MBD8638682.1 helix-turn-helix transcriptional regulator [Sphingomonas sp. CFBP 13733]